MHELQKEGTHERAVLGKRRWTGRLRTQTTSKQKSKNKKGKEKAHIVDETTSSSDEDKDVAFTNSETVFLSKNNSGVTHVLNTGASAHMTPHKNLLRSYKTFDTPKCISAANKGVFNALGAGTMILPIKCNGKSQNITLKDMLYAPDITFTLISIGKCDDTGYKTMFVDQKCTITSKASVVLLQAPKYHGLYRIDQ
jgi:hypothetical protein